MLLSIDGTDGRTHAGSVDKFSLPVQSELLLVTGGGVVSFSILGFRLDFGEDDVDVGGGEVLVEQLDVAGELGQLGAVHGRSGRRRAAAPAATTRLVVHAERAERLEHVLHSLGTAASHHRQSTNYAHTVQQVQ